MKKYLKKICEYCKRDFKTSNDKRVTCSLRCARLYSRDYLQRPEIKEKKRLYRERPEIKEKKRLYSQRPEIKEKQRLYRQRPEIKEMKR